MPNESKSQLPVTFTVLGQLSDDPTIVLPGGPCRGPEYLADLAGLGDQHSFVVLHPRGTPMSGGLSRGWWSDAADVIALADALGLYAFDLVAHSAGTRLGLATATRFPDRVRSMALITPPASWLSGTPSDAEAIASVNADPMILEALAHLTSDDPRTEQEFNESRLRQAPASYARWTNTEQSHAEVGAMSLAAAQAWFTNVPDDAVERIRAAALPPTLVVGGDSDLLTGVQPVRDYAAALGAEVTFIADCGHYPWIEQPEAFHQILHSWLTKAH